MSLDVRKRQCTSLTRKSPSIYFLKLFHLIKFKSKNYLWTKVKVSIPLNKIESVSAKFHRCRPAYLLVLPIMQSVFRVAARAGRARVAQQGRRVALFS